MKSTPPSPSASIRAGLATAVVMAILWTPGLAAAQCPPIQDAQYAIEQASTVFVGRVTATENGGLVANMQVLSVWKGRDLPGTVEVHGSADPDSPNSDNRYFEEGRTYLVIPENSRAPFLATACNPSRAYTASPNVIPASYQDGAGATLGRPPIGTDNAAATEAELTTSILPLLGLIALIAATWAIIVRLRSWEPQRAPSAAAESEQPPTDEKEHRLKRRSLRRDVVRTKSVAGRKVKRHKRGLKAYRRRQNRQVAALDKARASSESSHEVTSDSGAET